MTATSVLQKVFVKYAAPPAPTTASSAGTPSAAPKLPAAPSAPKLGTPPAASPVGFNKPNDHYFLPADAHGLAYGPRGGAPAYSANPTHFLNSPAHRAYLDKVKQQYPYTDDQPAAFFNQLKKAPNVDEQEKTWQNFVDAHPVADNFTQPKRTWFGDNIAATNQAREQALQAEFPTPVAKSTQQQPPQPSPTPTTSGQPAMQNAQPAATQPAPPAAPAPQPAQPQAKPFDNFEQTFQSAPPEQQTQIAQQAVQSHMQNVPDETKKGVQDLASGANTPEAKMFEQQVNDTGQKVMQENVAQQAQKNPELAASPQGFGQMWNQAMDTWNSMPQEAKWMVGLGVPLGAAGLMSSLFGEGGMAGGLLGLLGLGAAGLGAASSGLLGQGASNMVGDAAYNAGTFLGMIPEGPQDLSALTADDPIAALTASGGKDLSRDAVSKQVTEGRAKAEQLKKLMSAPVGPEVKMRLLQRLDPRIDSPEAAQKAYANAETLLKSYDNPDSPLSQKLQQAEQYGADKSWLGWAKEKALSSGLVKPGSDKMNTNDLVTRLTEKWAGIETAQMQQPKRKKAPYKLPEKFVQPEEGAKPVRASAMKKAEIVELCQKAARCWAGYEPVPGAKAYSKGSCRPKGSKKTQKEMKKT